MRPDSTFQYLGFRLDCEPVGEPVGGYFAQVTVYGPDGRPLPHAAFPNVITTVGRARGPAIEQGYRAGQRIVTSLLHDQERQRRQGSRA